jgi:predicted branched-subunit amino acid permease
LVVAHPFTQAIGLDFAIIAIFVATLPGMWRGTQDILPWLFASSIVLIWGTLFPEYASWGLIGGAVIGAMLAGLKNEY